MSEATLSQPKITQAKSDPLHTVEHRISNQSARINRERSSIHRSLRHRLTVSTL